MSENSSSDGFDDGDEYESNSDDENFCLYGNEPEYDSDEMENMPDTNSGEDNSGDR